MKNHTWKFYFLDEFFTKLIFFSISLKHQFIFFNTEIRGPHWAFKNWTWDGPNLVGRTRKKNVTGLSHTGSPILSLKTHRSKSRECELQRVKPPWPPLYSHLSLLLSHPPPLTLTTLVPPVVPSNPLSFTAQSSSLLPNSEEAQFGEGSGLHLQRPRLTTYLNSSEREISKTDVIPLVYAYYAYFYWLLGLKFWAFNRIILSAWTGISFLGRFIVG